MTDVMVSGEGFFLQPLHLHEFVGLEAVMPRNYWRVSIDRLIGRDGALLPVPVDEILVPFDRVIARKERFPYFVGDRVHIEGPLVAKRFSPDRQTAQAGRQILRQAEQRANDRTWNWLKERALPAETRALLWRQLKNLRAKLMQRKLTFARYQRAEMRLILAVDPHLASPFLALREKQREDVAAVAAQLNQLMPETLVVGQVLGFKKISTTGHIAFPFNGVDYKDTKRANDSLYQRARMQTWEQEYNWDLHHYGGVIRSEGVQWYEVRNRQELAQAPWQSGPWEARETPGE